MTTPSPPIKSTSYSGSAAFDQALAGLSAGAISTLILHPIDLVKTKLQADESKRGSQRLIGRAISSFKTTISIDGFKGLYRGLSPNLAGSALSWSFYFGWYSIIKQTYSADLGDGRVSHNMTSAQYMLASAQAGALTLLCTNPIWVVKTRMLTSNSKDIGAYRGLIDGLYKLIRLEGIRGMYRGLTPALFGTSHGALQFMAYEELKRWKTFNGNDVVKKTQNGLPSFDYLWMATLSKTFAAVTTYPYQVVKTRLQRSQIPNIGNNYSGVIDTIQKILRNEGIAGLYKGLGPNTIRVLPGTCITFLVYENLSSYFRAHAT